MIRRVLSALQRLYRRFPPGMPAAGAAAGSLFLVHHALSPWRPAAARPGEGWWGFADQGRYLRSALAWAAGDLRPDEHWYAPGYPLLAAPFVRVTEADPFLLPNLALLLASLWLTAAIAARLVPGWPHARSAGALTFLATSVLPPDVLGVWVIPWTTTPATALTLLCLHETLRVLDAPVTTRCWRRVLGAAAAAACIPAFRPSDGVVVAGVCGLAIALRLVAVRPGRVVAARVVLPAFAVAAAVAVATLALHWSVHGWAPGEYLAGSAAVGFEWRIVPLQWVGIVLSARPLLPESNGLVARMPWIVPGLAGMAACLAAPPWGGTRRAHALVVGLAALQVLQYLAYRDLHPPGLWRHLNYHYFKWLFPVFGWYAVLFGAVLLRRRRVAAAAGAAVVLAVVPWRAELVLRAELPPPAADGTVAIPAGLGVWDALLVPAEGSWDAVYHGAHSYRFGPDFRRHYGPVGRLVAYKVPGGVMLAPVFPLPPGEGRAVFDAGVVPRVDAPVRLARQRIVYGVPCFLSTRLHRLAACGGTDR